MLRFKTMRFLFTATIVVLASLASFSQDAARQIYDTERAFERAVAEKGINAGFIEYLSPLGVPTPSLATSWEFDATGAALDMTLREGVVFHDGTVKKLVVVRVFALIPSGAPSWPARCAGAICYGATMTCMN